jgi:hypothetical protein
LGGSVAVPRAYDAPKGRGREGRSALTAEVLRSRWPALREEDEGGAPAGRVVGIIL